MNLKSVATFAIAALIAAPAFAAKPVPALPTVDGMAVYSAGKKIGSVLFARPLIGVISTKGYFFQFDIQDARIRTESIYFAGSGCSGQAYMRMSSDAWAVSQGYVIALQRVDYDTLYYVPRHSALQSTSYASYFDGYLNCIDSMSVAWLAPAFLNDEAITGVPNTRLAFPITFGIP